MRKLRLVRLTQTEEGAIGVLQIDGIAFCFTIERDSNDQKYPQIPAGHYPVKRFHGKKWQDTFEIIIPGHTAVLFHAGNTEVDSQMCVILGRRTGKLNGKLAVLESSAAFMDFMRALNSEQSMELSIEDFYPRESVSKEVI
jgi:hypothetical protein